MPGRTYPATLGIARPTALVGGGIEGPYTTWYADGTLESHGTYQLAGSRSIPHGLWGFWHPDGTRNAILIFRNGEPDGCIALYSRDGTSQTFIAEGNGRAREARCSPPPDDELIEVEGGGVDPGAQPDPVAIDFAVQPFYRRGNFGARHGNQVDPDPSDRYGISFVARKRFDRLRLGLSAAALDTAATGYSGLTATAVAALSLPSLHPRLDLEASVEAGVQALHVHAMRRTQPGSSQITFWAPLVAAQLTGAVALSSMVEIFVAARVDGTVERGIDRETSYCDRVCGAPVPETWQVGGFGGGATAGVRLLFR